jgi:hypothetical protein
MAKVYIAVSALLICLLCTGCGLTQQENIATLTPILPTATIEYT